MMFDRTLRLLLPLFLLTTAAAAALPSTAAALPAGFSAQEPAEQEHGIWGDMPTLPERVREAILDGREGAALALIAEYRDSGDGAADFWTYLDGVVRARGEDLEAALRSFEEVSANWPDSLWRHKARFHRAETLRRLGRWEEAQTIYEQEVARLRGDERQGELADVTLGFADSLSTPDPASPDAGATDYAKAITLYGKVVDLDPPKDRLEHALYRIAWCQQQRESWAEAAQAWLVYLEAFDPRSDTSGAVGSGAGAPGRGDEAADEASMRVYEARLERGRCLRMSGQGRDARNTFEDLAARIATRLEADSGLAEDTRGAMDRLRGEALYRVAGCFGQQSDGHERAIGALRRFLAAYPAGHAHSDDARFAIAQRQLLADRAQDALASLRALIAAPPATAPDEEDRERAARQRVRAEFLIGEALMRLGEYEEAGRAFASYVAKHPAGEDWAEAQANIVRADYEVGAELKRRGEFAAARAAWAGFLERRPLNPDARDIFYAIGDLHREEAETLPEDSAEREAAFRAAIQHWSRLISKYPGTDQASRALFMTGWLQEMQLGELEEAVASYQRCDFGSSSSSARMRLEIMLEESLVVNTERTWRAGEDARLKVRVRNLAELEVQVYPLDLESYFRKHLRHTGVEDLDLDLIAPSASFTVPVEDYARWKPLAQELTLPVEGPGTWAVAITAGELRATTLVVRSDVDIVVKSSRKDLLLWAEDMSRLVPAKNTRFLVSFPGAGENGEPRIEEAVAGEDGIARMDLEALGVQQVDDVHVLAVRDGHVAATGMGRSGLGATDGAQPRAYVYTDRSAYQPGEAVHWRAVMRDAEGGNYRVRPGQRYLVTVRDAQARLLKRERMDLSEFGTVSGEVRLDRAAPAGNYSIRFEAPDGRSFQGGFRVAEFQLAKIGVDVELDRSVYYRGEEVSGSITAAWHYGERLAGARVQLHTPDGKMRELATDAEGKVEFRFDTRRLDAAGNMNFQVSLPEEGAQAWGRAFLATTGYAASVSVPRAVYLAGEQLPVSLQTTAPDGEAVARALTLEAVRFEPSRHGGLTERIVQTLEVSTDEEGRASVSLALDDGGDYTLRVSGVDRFENPVVAQASVYVSGEKDAVQLRMLTELTQVDVGETLELRLHNRAGAGLGLLTFEGEGVLHYRLVRLQEGENRIELEVDHRHFPNFVAAASLMHDTRLHVASAPFQVHRALQVSLAPAREDYRPGEEAEVRIEVRDQRGQPVRAELSLAAVDAALFAQFPDPHPAIRTFFHLGLTRHAEMRTESSISFAYEGETEQVAEAVLEEMESQEAARAWDSRRQEALGELRDKAARPPASPAMEPSETALGAFSRGGLGLAPSAGPQLGVADFGFASEAWNDSIGVGGGAGGRFGGRGGRSAQAGSVREVEGPDAVAAYWNPSVITGEDGIATVRFTLPERSTRWRLMARGADGGASFGQAESALRTKADFFVEMRAPARLTSGDRPVVVARVHNAGEAGGEVALELRLGGDLGALVGTATVQVPAGEVVEQRIELPAAVDSAAGGIAELVLSATPTWMEDFSYELVREIPVAPWGVELGDAAAGLLAGVASLELELPAGDYRDLRLELTLGGDLDRLLVDEALGRAPRPWRHSVASDSVAAMAADLVGVCAVLQYLDQGGRTSGDDFRALRERGDALLASLVARQRDDGGWAWVGEGRQASPETTARAMAALSRASARGLLVPTQTLDLGRAALASMQQAAGTQEDERKAQLLWARAQFGDADFGLANRLHRERNGLSSAALAYVTLALHKMGSSGMAAEAARELEQRWGTEQGFDRSANLGWHRAPLEMDALALLALQAALPDSELIEACTRRLASYRPWHGDSAGLAVAAMAEHRTHQSRAGVDSVVTVKIGDGDAKEYTLDASKPEQQLSLALETSQRALTVRLERRGRGEVHYLAQLLGATNGVPEKTARNAELVVNGQYYLAPHPRYRGREYPGGFGSVRDYDEQWTNEVSSVPLGGKLRTQYSVYQRWERGDREQEADFLSLEIPLPAGTRLLEDSVQGSVQDWYQADGRLVVLFGQMRGGATVYFELVGAVPGQYKVLPPVVRSIYRPIPAALGEAMDFAVLERGAEGLDEYRETPDELFHIGRAMYHAGDRDGAWAKLTKLHDEFGDWLREQQLRESAEMLLFLAIEREQPNRIVQYFEILKEKNPELTVPFAQMLEVGEAYRALSEFERAYLIFRAIVDETYGKDLKIAGVLEEQGDFHAASEALLRMWTEYPDSPAVVETHLTLADMLLQKAPVAHEDASLRAARRDRAILTTDGIFLLQRFLALYAQDPLAADAGLNLVNAYLDLEDYATAASLAEEMADRFKAPRYSDAFRYTRAVASWYLGEEDVALGLLQGIADAVYTDEQGRETPSENRELAIYILGQIHHSRQDFATAAEYYERVDEVFADAREVLAGFRKRDVRLEEVTTARPGEDVVLELNFKNVEEAELLVYAVDLMTLYLREKNLTGVTAVNLAGIAPTLAREVTLKPDGSMREQQETVQLDLPEPGAYLVICRSGALHASGLVLVSDLELEVGEDPVSGRLRVQAIDQAGGRYLRDVDVRVIGSGNERFTTGATDPRGIFVADEVMGRSTVIARHDERHFAFFRGEQVLGQPQQESGRDDRNLEYKQLLDNDSYFDNVRGLNSMQQQGRKRSYQEELKRGREGVQVKQVK